MMREKRRYLLVNPNGKSRNDVVAAAGNRAKLISFDSARAIIRVPLVFYNSAKSSLAAAGFRVLKAGGILKKLKGKSG